MASITETTNYATGPFSGFADAILRAVERMGDRQGRRVEFDRLSQLTDAELAAEGLTRATIPNRVFASLYHI